MKNFLFIFLIVFLTNKTTCQTSLQQINLKHGNYSIGYQHYTLIDSTRTYYIKNEFNNNHIFRPVPISIWYPAKYKDHKNSTNTVLNYLEILKEEEEWKYLPNYFLLDWFSYLWNTHTNKSHLNEKVNAKFNATAIDKKFPVILYHASFQKTSIENFAICEYLASHGYVVFATPSRGKNNKNLEGTAVDNITSQVRTLEFLLQYIHQLKNVDINKIALMSYSFGGLTNAILAMKNAKIKALISLDGTERYNYQLLEKLPFYNHKKLNIPYVHFAQKDIPDSILKAQKMRKEINYEFKFYDSISNSNAYSYKFHNLTHTYFSSFDVLFAQRDKKQDKSDEKIMESYAILSEHVLQFANAFLKDDTNSKVFMENTPFQNEYPINLLSKKMKKAVAKSFNYKDFNDLALKRDYKNLVNLFQTTKEKYPNLKLNESMLNILGLKLSFHQKEYQKGINILLLAIHIYPKSANLYDSLAEAYYLHKDFNNAKINFEKSLVLNPNNRNATNRLKELKN